MQQRKSERREVGDRKDGKKKVEEKEIRMRRKQEKWRHEIDKKYR